MKAAIAGSNPARSTRVESVKEGRFNDIIKSVKRRIRRKNLDRDESKEWDREEFKELFRDLAVMFGVTQVEFRKVDENFPFEKLQIGNYNIERKDIWIIQEWKDRYLPTHDLIYYAFHELGHHLQLVQGIMKLNWRGNVRSKQLPELEVLANEFASKASEPCLRERIQPRTDDTYVYTPRHGESPWARPRPVSPSRSIMLNDSH